MSSLRKTLKTMTSILAFENKALPSEIAQDLYKDSLDDAITCDLIIKCGPDLFQYYGHRIIFASASDFLKNLLSTAIPGKLAVLILPDIEPRTLKLLMRYIYNGEIEVNDDDTYDKFTIACQLLGIPEAEMHYSDKNSDETTKISDPESVMNMEIVKIEYETAENAPQFDENSPNCVNNISDFDKSSQFSIPDSDNSKDLGIDVHEDDFVDDSSSQTSTSESAFLPDMSIDVNDSDFVDVNENLEAQKESPEAKSNRYKKMQLTSRESSSFLMKAKKCFEVVYKKINEKPRNLERSIALTEIKFSKPHLVKAQHRCPFNCGNLVSIFLDLKKNDKCWSNKSFLEHLKKRHKLTF